MMGSRFRVNSPQVVHETIDNEVIIVNLDTGSYYGLQQVGARVWELLASGASVDRIAADAVSRYAADAVSIEAAVRDLVTELEQEGLIAPVATTDRLGSDGASADGPAPDGKLPFERPVLQKYTDMQELLLLDPVHEADETGWPKAAPPGL